MTKNPGTLCLCAVALLALAGGRASACSLEGWSRVVGPQSLSVGTPGDGHRRYQGECGLRVQLGATAASYVEDNSPDGETAYKARFYLYADEATLGNGEWVDVFTAYRGESSPAAEVSVRLARGADGPTLALRASDGTRTAQSAPVPVDAGWHGIVLSWQQATGASNGQATWTVDGISAPGLAGLDNRSHAIDLARLGVVSRQGGDGRLAFDAFESHRSTPVDLLLAGDANGDKQVNATDLVTTVKEYKGGPPAPGQPDCNGDGKVDQADMNCIAHAIIGW